MAGLQRDRWDTWSKEWRASWKTQPGIYRMTGTCYSVQTLSAAAVAPGLLQRRSYSESSETKGYTYSPNSGLADCLLITLK